VIRIILSLLVFVFLFEPNQLKAQGNLQTMIETGISLANGLTEYQTELLHAEFDVLKTSDNTRSSYRALFAGQGYGISALGGERIKDLDIIVYKPSGDDWIEVARDKSTSPEAIVFVFPETSDLYRIDVIAYKFDARYLYEYYGLFVASGAGNNSQSMSEFMSSSLSSIRTIESQLDYQLIRAEFDIVNKSSLTTKSMLRELIGGVNYYAFAVGGSLIEDIDLYLYKSTKNGWSLQQKNNSTGSAAVVQVSPMSNNLYRFDVEAYSLKTGYTADVYGLFLFLK